MPAPRPPTTTSASGPRKSGTRSPARTPAKTGERYLPKKARAALDKSEYDRTTAKKRADSARGRQHSKQPADVAAKTAKYRDTGAKAGTAAKAGDQTRAELMRKAAERGVRGRSRMKKDELVAALS